MKCERLFKTVESLYERYVTVWEDVCNIESPTDYKAGVDACGEYFIRIANEKGWDVQVFEQPVSGNVVCITMNPNAEKSPVFFSGHLDTVHPIGLFGSPAVRRDAEKIYGPGVTDCKGGTVAALMAMDALDRCGFTSRPVKLLLQADEEGGSSRSGKDTIKRMCELAKGAAAFINLEGYSEGQACVLRKGIITFSFKITGIEAHSSLCARAGANAIAEAAYKIIELEKLKDDEGLTCNCGVISGGSVPNTVAGTCEFKANVRFADADQLEWVKEYARKVADTVHVKGCTCELSVCSTREAMQREERNFDLVDRMNGIFEANGLPRLAPSKRNGGSDAAEITVYAKAPCVDSLGVEGGRIHSPEEFALLASLTESAKRMAAVAMCLE